MTITTPHRRPPELRRSWLFVGGVDEAALDAAGSAGADVLILELEDFTPPAARPVARARAGELFAAWRAAGIIAAVRVNPLESDDGMADLDAVMTAGPDAVLLPKVAETAQLARLDVELVDNVWQVTEAWTTGQLKPSFNDFVYHNGHLYGFDQHIFTCISVFTWSATTATISHK